jgi:amidohydrolase
MDPKLLERIVEFRQEIHQHPEINFQEFETHKRIKNILIELGVDSKAIREVSVEGQAPTGLIVDLKGKAEPKGNPFCVAFRADMDALLMTELNENLPYKSKNVGKAHMCGHDGHMACLVGFVPLFLKEAEHIPNNKTVRLLFQPAEETVTGAKFMVEKGCLEGVDEVYGFHNWPVGKVG